MKIRKGFVSNSSSSSFICDVCGRNESGWDMCLDEAEMYECKNDHIFCESDVIGDPFDFHEDEVIKKLKKEIKQNKECAKEYPESSWAVKRVKHQEELLKNEDVDGIIDELGLNERGGVNEKHCPICQMSELSDSDALKYFMKINKTNKKKLLTEIKKKFKSDYDKFKEFISE
jgi:hypothetical protein